MKSIENIKWLVIIGLILYIVLLQQCSPKDNTKDIVNTVDTLVISRVDTVNFHDTIPIRVPIYITKPPIIIVDTVTNDTLNKYITEVNDSLIDGLVTSVVKGKLVEQNFEYIPKFPKYIIKTDSIFIESTIKEFDKPRTKLFIGGELGGNQTSINISPVVGIAAKNGYNYSYRYGLINKTHNFIITKNLNFSKKKFGN